MRLNPGRIAWSCAAICARDLPERNLFQIKRLSIVKQEFENVQIEEMFLRLQSCTGETSGVSHRHAAEDAGRSPVGSFATILQVMPEWRGRRKFADVGLIPGTELLMEAHAPFGGLLRIRLLETSMALHRDDAACILIKEEEPAR